MNLNKSINKALKAALLVAGMLFLAPSGMQAKKIETFGVGDKTFLLNGKPFIVKAAEVHYPRIPQPYWEQRIKMCKALGMNTLCLYVFWNIHEQQEGVFDFTGNNDVAAFIKLAQKNGMYVIVRPGPYVCAEWEMGGLPWWLLKKKDIRLREQDPYFMERYSIFAKKLGEQIGHLTIEKGGPIIMVQVENEYGSYGEDKPYISAIRDIIRKSGFDKVALFQCDWSSNFTKNGLDDLIWTMNFGTGANIDNEFKKLGQLRPNSPKMCSEFWSGWFDKWGGRHETRGSKEMFFVRSVYLQGLVFQKPENLAPHMEFARPTLEKFQFLCNKYHLAPATLALSYALSLPGVTSLVLGSEKTEQVRQNVALMEQAVDLSAAQMAEIRELFLDTPEQVLNPALWPKP